MRIFTTILALVGLTSVAAGAPPQGSPSCTFDPEKREYVYPETATPPICKFDPVKGEYVCPPLSASNSATPDEDRNDITFIAGDKCGVEGLRKCTRQRQGSVCKNGKWELVHRCLTGQQCDMKNGNFCCRTRGPGFKC